MPIEQSFKELTFISYFLSSHNSSNSCASAPFRRLPSVSSSHSWCVRHDRDLALELVKENISDSSSMVDSNPFTTIIYNLNLTIPMGSHCLLIGANECGKSTILRILGGRHLSPPDSEMRVLGLNSFRDTKINFHCAYIDTNWGMCTGAFVGVGITLMTYITV